ncbi:Carotenoid oxygenase [Corchorus olitorius]|uniref:Carotenoid oxygenase n=1 Tax=Corchorus olitorius TaxID=93759 RepID=A0A1R3HB09_9ROSI|nr:Carotenoid oxygenase [Corchorus olitorius]
MAPPLSVSSFLSTLASIPHLLHNILDPPLHPWADPTHVYAGNMAPVDEMEPIDCPIIEGKLPVSLKGVYIRNGPNPQFLPPRALIIYDGDGMLHSLRISDGKATYCSRYVKTYKYLLEKEAGFPIVPNIVSGFFGFGDIARFVIAMAPKILTGHFNLMNGFGVANTSIAFVANKLFALCDSDLPYEINVTKEGDIGTLGRWEFERKFMSNINAHPKVDLDTKETFALTWSLTFPHHSFLRFDENGVKKNEVPISSMNQLSSIHDFAITKRFIVFHETQMVFSLGKVMTGRGTLIQYEPNKVSRIGIIPKYATNDSEMKWFPVPGFNTIHLINAWESEEDDDEIVLVAPNVLSADNIFNTKIPVSLEKLKMNMKTGDVSREIISSRNLEFGTINPGYVGRRTRYAYLGLLEESPKMSAVVKIDLETGQEVARRFYGPNCYGGEPLFVRRDGEINKNSDDDEDDGYIMTFVHDEKANESKFIIMDAKSPELEIIAVVKMPRRVPYGIHGLFLTK